MSIKINPSMCKGCKKCSDVCPGNLIAINHAGKAEIACREDCWGCLSCVKDCEFGAIRFYLGADIGGRGTTLYTKAGADEIDWIFESPEGGKRKMTIYRKDSNAY